MPRTEFPISSKGGDQRARPITPGMTSIMAPETPDLAGRPTVKANSPEKSYMPQEYIRDRQFLTVSLQKIWVPVRGQMPPFARVAATAAMFWVCLLYTSPSPRD